MTRLKFLLVAFLGSVASAFGIKPKPAQISDAEFSRIVRKSQLSKQWLDENGFKTEITENQFHYIATMTLKNASGDLMNSWGRAWPKSAGMDCHQWAGSLLAIAKNGWRVDRLAPSEITYSRDGEGWDKVDVIHGPIIESVQFQEPDWWKSVA